MASSLPTLLGFDPPPRAFVSLASKSEAPWEPFCRGQGHGPRPSLARPRADFDTIFLWAAPTLCEEVVRLAHPENKKQKTMQNI